MHDCGQEIQWNDNIMHGRGPFYPGAECACGWKGFYNYMVHKFETVRS